MNLLMFLRGKILDKDLIKKITEASISTYKHVQWSLVIKVTEITVRCRYAPARITERSPGHIPVGKDGSN